MPKKQKYKNTKGGKEKESLQNGCLKINEAGKNREPEVVALQNDTKKKLSENHNFL